MNSPLQVIHKYFADKLGQQIYASVLCALNDKLFEDAFTDPTRKFLSQLDLILKADPVPENVKRLFSLDTATVDLLLKNGC